MNHFLYNEEDYKTTAVIKNGLFPPMMISELFLSFFFPLQQHCIFSVTLTSCNFCAFFEFERYVVSSLWNEQKCSFKCCTDTYCNCEFTTQELTLPQK